MKCRIILRRNGPPWTWFYLLHPTFYFVKSFFSPFLCWSNQTKSSSSSYDAHGLKNQRMGFFMFHRNSCCKKLWGISLCEFYEIKTFAVNINFAFIFSEHSYLTQSYIESPIISANDRTDVGLSSARISKRLGSFPGNNLVCKLLTKCSITFQN